MVSLNHPGDEATDERRSERKRKAILAAAATAFLQSGYRGTSMDEIAARAGVSKQTVYKHFADKERLFVEIVTSIVDEISDPVYQEVRRLGDSGDLEADLQDLACRELASIMQPRLLQLRRLVIGEASRFPELGRVFHERGPGRTILALASAFEQLAARGLLRLDDPKLAAAQFNWLVVSAPMNDAMLLGADEPPSADAIERQARSAARTFLSAYGTR